MFTVNPGAGQISASLSGVPATAAGPGQPGRGGGCPGGRDLARVNAGRPAHALEDADDGGGDIDLPWIGAMPGAGWVGMVHVVPALTQREQAERPQVAISAW